MLEAVLNPDGERYYSFSPQWSETETIASISNGSGDEFDIIFSPVGAHIRGLDHESPDEPVPPRRRARAVAGCRGLGPQLSPQRSS